ncbi:MAG: type II toxin-antitoxin system RelE/ParE family toxin [Leptospiraceae bacterium]|nr:type II toxin-antitoxin system RelE/ParE family toxin [Leptospiraceae bacterium]
MAKRVVWSENAVSDRINILDYWFKRLGSKRYSKQLDSNIRRIIELLAKFPGMGRRFNDREERFFVVDHYLIIYSETNERLEILHLWDSRRNPDDLIL